MNTYQLSDVCRLLGVDISTLRRWIKRSNIEILTDEVDHRRSLITLDNIERLAWLYDREITPLGKEKSKADSEHDSEQIVSSQLEARLTALEDRLTRIEEQLEELRSQAQPIVPARTERPAKTPGQAPAIEELAPGLVPALEFARAHGIDKKPLYNAINRANHPLQVSRGNYPGGVKMALDQAQQAQFYELFSEHAGFLICSDCPHK